MSRIYWRQLCLIWSGLSLLLVGCGRSPTVERHPVFPLTGLVKLNGEPAAGVSLAFFPVGTTRGRGGFAVTQPSGEFEVVSPDGQPGLPEGDYRVLLAKWTMPDGSPIPTGASAADNEAINSLPAVYSDLERAPSAVKVLPGENPVVMIDVKQRRLAQR